jgi:hypothetical protein
VALIAFPTEISHRLRVDFSGLRCYVAANSERGKNAEKNPYITDCGFVSDKFDGNYLSSGIILSASSGFVKNIGYSTYADWLLIPNEVGGSPSTYIPDYYYQNWGSISDTVAVVGGSWCDGAASGLFFWDVMHYTSSASMYMCTRALLIP